MGKAFDTAVRVVPDFGGIHLEDVSAPECFEIERRLTEAVRRAAIDSGACTASY
jgi:malic enzyme